MKRIMIALMCLGTPAMAQKPFDMTPERPSAETPEPSDSIGSAPVLEAVPAVGTTSADIRRHLLPMNSLMLGGENPSRNLAIHLTAAQASSAARLHLAFRNSVFVAPESSRLRVSLNNVLIIDQPIQAADDFLTVDAEVPPQLLRAGRNELSMRVDQRHRTDCTIGSTYELWTELDPARTYLSFSDEGADRYMGLADLRAIAPGLHGRSRIEIVAPALERDDMTTEVLSLAQALALHVNQPNLEFSISHLPQLEDADLVLRVLLGAPHDLTPHVGDEPQGSAVSFYSEAGADVPTLLVRGRDRAEWRAAINQILAPVDREVDSRREAFVTEHWRAPNAPMIYGNRSLTLGELGIASEQFSGRRYAREFTFAIPADFYASSYGNARLLLDAAFSDAVRPGSAINIYVNGNIAASMPLTVEGGTLVNQLPIGVTMRHFRPGLNAVTIEANLLTEQDDVCLPGASSDATPRFAIFDTSRFVVPDYGRIAQFPNLAATSGTGYPYGQTATPVAIVLDGDRKTLSAAANILSRLAVSAGRSIPLSSTYSIDAARQQHAIFIGAANSMPPGVLAQVGVVEETRTDWVLQQLDRDPVQEPERTNVDEWLERLGGGGLRDVQRWFSDTFGITVDMMRFLPSGDVVFKPDRADVLLVAQGLNPAGTGVWTAFTAPSADGLKSGSVAVAEFDRWQKLAGRVSTLESDMETVANEPVSTVSFVESHQPTFGNYRLIVANWLSANILSYSLLLVLACLLLGVTTSGLLSRLGRHR